MIFSRNRSLLLTGILKSVALKVGGGNSEMVVKMVQSGAGFYVFAVTFFEY